MEEWKTYKITYIGANQYTKELRVRNIYEVSNMGRVKRNGKLVDFSCKNYTKRQYYGIGSFYVHRAVAELFISNPNNYPCVDHINGDIHDNRAENLRWCTAKMNSNYDLARKHMSEAQKGKKRGPYKKKL